MNFTFADLFAGIGGFHLALHNFGGKCVLAAEIDKFARETYIENFKHLSPEVFDSGLFIEDVNQIETLNNIPDIDLIAAGFPCQPFSYAGLKKGFKDTRGTLFHSIIALAKKKIDEGTPPKVLLLENVKGLVNHDKGKTLKVILESLEAIGYKHNAKVLNSKDFGIPQNRERIFIVAWQKDIADDFTFPEPSMVNTKVEDILEDLNEAEVDTFTISDKLWNGHRRRKREHRQKGNGFGYSLFDADSEYTSTISARYYKDGSEILIKQSGDLNPRKLTPREAARLQGYPEEFRIPVSNTQAYKQFGNSVAVPVVNAIVNEIVDQFFNKKLNSIKETSV